MRAFFTFTLLVAIPACMAEGALITGLFNTGVNGSNTPLTDFQSDPHYSIISQPSPGGAVGIAIPQDGFPIGQAWVLNSSTSRWIAPNYDSDGNGPNGTYVYRTTFTLPSNVVLSSVVITGLWSTDNEGSGIFINGFSTGNILPSSTPFTNLFSFTVNSHFVVGQNTLDFSVQNDGGPTGLRVDSISGTFNTQAAVPEPASLAIWSLGFFASAIGAYRRRSQKKTY